jgi:isopenicillin N synthase-like dioxygenase
MKVYDFEEIAVQPIRSGNAMERRLDPGIRKDIEQACSDVGIFYVTCPGIDVDFVDRVFDEAKAFFDQPDEEKMKSRASFENYYMGFRPVGSEKSVSAGEYEQCEQYKLGFVKRPDGTSCSNVAERLSSSVFRKSTQQFWDSAQELSSCLQRYFATILGYEDDFFDRFMQQPLHNLGLNYYPDVNEDKDRLHAHIDYSLFTIILQESPGLLVKPRKGDWLEAPIMKGRLLVMVGEYLLRWSRGSLWAPPHRVSRGVSGKRYAVIYKQRPSFDTVISIPGRREVHIGRLYEEKLRSIVGGFPESGHR